jgi:hypothetical protein
VPTEHHDEGHRGEDKNDGEAEPEAEGLPPPIPVSGVRSAHHHLALVLFVALILDLDDLAEVGRVARPIPRMWQWPNPGLSYEEARLNGRQDRLIGDTGVAGTEGVAGRQRRWLTA